MKDISSNKKDDSYENDTIKFKSFQELESYEFSGIKLEDFKKSQLNEFKEKELGDFKRFLNYSKTDISIENLRSELNSDNAIKNVLKELKDIGLDGKVSLKLLKRLKMKLD